MCTSTPKAAKAPEAPEPVKTTDEEMERARADARNAAIRRYGARATDVTRGSVSDAASVKRPTLGA